MALTTAVAYLILIGGIAIIITLCSLLIHGFDNLESNISSEAETQTNETNENEANRDPVAAAIASYHQNRDAHERQRSRQDTVTIRVITATGAFALIAAAAAISSNFVSYGQFEQARRAADIAKETSERQLRAYVGVLDVAIKCEVCKSLDSQNAPKFIPAGNWLENTVTLTLQNGGITPAYNAVVRGTWNEVPFGGGLPKNFDFTIEDEENDLYQPPEGVATINPGEKGPTHAIITPRDLPIIMRARLRKSTAFFYGSITYSDVFGICRETPFCFRYIPELSALPFSYCNEHNTPRDCKKKAP